MTEDDIVIPAHPEASAILSAYPPGTVVQFADGQNFIVGFRAPQAIVLVPITEQDAELACSSTGATTSALSPN